MIRIAKIFEVVIQLILKEHKAAFEELAKYQILERNVFSASNEASKRQLSPE